MKFTTTEQNAIAYIVNETIANGSGSFMEKLTADELLLKVGYDPETRKLPPMIFQDAINAIKPMPIEKKKTVLAIVANLMVVDGEIHIGKQQWLNTISTFCAIPAMNWDETWNLIDAL